MSAVDEVKERLDIVEVIQSYVPLKKAGRNYKGLCPFHSEKTPSFVVFPDTGTWHCFGACGTGGDVFSFIQKQENLDFGEALKLLARRAGVELEAPGPQATEAEQRLNRLRELNRTAAAYFHHLLVRSDEAGPARGYLESRGLQQETIDRFQVGYALDQWDALLRYLGSKGYLPAEVAEAGLLVEREDGSGYYDRFRGRILFPIRDQRGHTIGFGGRVLGAGEPKYLNTPQTPLFDKSSVLFGIDQASRGIRTSGMAVIVEGYMDVLMAHQHGINNVVAQMGTALTEAQLKLLKRYTQHFVLALDADIAGDQATLRGLDVARQVMDREVVPVPTARGLIRFEDRLTADIRIASLPSGRDPDEVIRSSPSLWAQLVADAKPVMDYYFQALTAELDLSTARGKSEAARALGPLVAEVGDPVQRAHYLQQLARIVQVDERLLWQQIQQATGHRTAARRPRSAATEQQAYGASFGLEEYCLSRVLSHAELLDQADALLRQHGDEPFREDDLKRPEDRALLEAWRGWRAAGGLPDANGQFLDSLDENLQDRTRALLKMAEAQPTAPDGLNRDRFLDDITRLRIRNLRRQNEEIQFLLADAEAVHDREAVALYGALIRQTGDRLRRLYRALAERSVAGRRQKDDVKIRVPFSER
jgi:DNA primase